MQGSDQMGHSNVCKVGTKWVTLMCNPPIPHFSAIIFQTELNWLSLTFNLFDAEQLNFWRLFCRFLNWLFANYIIAIFVRPIFFVGSAPIVSPPWKLSSGRWSRYTGMSHTVCDIPISHRWTLIRTFRWTLIDFVQ